jgi:hypothetical protein
MSGHCGLRTADFLLVISQIFLLEHYSKERVNLADQACIQPQQKDNLVDFLVIHYACHFHVHL